MENQILSNAIQILDDQLPEGTDQFNAVLDFEKFLQELDDVRENFELS